MACRVGGAAREGRETLYILHVLIRFQSYNVSNKILFPLFLGSRKKIRSRQKRESAK